MPASVEPLLEVRERPASGEPLGALTDEEHLWRARHHGACDPDGVAHRFDRADRTRRQYTAPHLRWLLRQADRVFVQTLAERDAAVSLGVSPERVVLQGLGDHFGAWEYVRQSAVGGRQRLPELGH